MPEDWKLYRTRFLVRAKQLTRPVTFTDTLGREHRGRPGDYLVEGPGGLVRITPREIFEDVYVLMTEGRSLSASATTSGSQLRVQILSA